MTRSAQIQKKLTARGAWILVQPEEIVANNSKVDMKIHAYGFETKGTLK